MHPHHAPAVTHQRGIALMLVIWVLTLLTVMAVSMTATQRTELALTDNHVEEVRFRLHSDAALAFVAWQLSQPLPLLDGATSAGALALPPGEKDGAAGNFAAEDVLESELALWLPDGSAHEWQFAGTALTLTVFNERSRLALNQASAPTLAALLEALAVPKDEALALADALIDWRDADHLTQLNGAEDDDYQTIGAAFGAKDEPLVAIEELQQVRGMTRELYQRLAPELTLADNGGNPALVTEFASAAVLAATQGIPLAEAQLQLQTRLRTPNRGGPLYRVVVTQAPAVTTQVGRSMEALLELTPGQTWPYLVYWRRFGMASCQLSDGSCQ